MSDAGDELTSDQLLRRCDAETFSFETTEELESLEQLIGQDRAVRSISFGLEVDSPGYHIFGLGPRGTGKTKTIQRLLERESADESVPSDWCYVNNFDDPDCPIALRLPTGRGHELREDMDELVDELRSEVPDAFDSEEYQKERENIQAQFQERRQQLFQQLEDEANQRGFTVLGTPQGPMLAPVRDGNILTPDQFNELDDETRKQIEENREELREKLRETFRTLNEVNEEMREQIRELDRRIIEFSVGSILKDIKEKYHDLDNVMEFLDNVETDIVENVPMFKRINQMEHVQGGFPQAMMQQQGLFEQYRVNLIVDNRDTDGAPVVYEHNPTYHNLVGRIEHQGQFGTLTTNFRMIKHGALHQANGGYLILDAKDVLSKPFAWDALKRSLQTSEIKTEVMGQEFRAIQTQSLEPENIPLDVKVILVGNPLIYYLLYNLDEDFQELFKVKADFAVQTEWDEDTTRLYAQFIGTLCEDEELEHFAPDGVARLVEEGARMTSDQKKISTMFGDLADIVRESSYWTRVHGNQRVRRDDVEEAIEQKIYRSNRIEERIRELIDEGTILIDTEGEVVGQVNGLSVLQLGDYQFGKPSRITARTYVGSEGVVNIDRETELGGPIHNKGVMILTGYMGGEFAQEQPLSLSATLTFEQQYEGVEGDSASSTELYALLSSLSGFPIRQDLAVTGSVNQRGQVQSIGGVNEKIEGFFRVCRESGLTGDQGVLIPESNVDNLMLRREVREAVEENQFHIYPVSHVDEGIELLTGKPAGERTEDGEYPKGTVKRAVQDRLRTLAETVREFGRSEDGSNEE